MDREGDRWVQVGVVVSPCDCPTLRMVIPLAAPNVKCRILHV